jgi:uncharacterized protein YodC (DUF2158 family)
VITIQEGDLVQLHAGGPAMSVQELLSHLAKCIWFDNEGRLQERIFSLNVLRKVRDGGSRDS